MKKFNLLLTAFLTGSLLINAQGVQQIWGTTINGGPGNSGVIFSTDASGSNFHMRFNFSSLNHPGSTPLSDLVEYNGKFYSMTNAGGDGNGGLIYEWDPRTNGYIKKIDLSNSIGYNPQGSLTLSGNKFYGVTTSGGANDAGVIFEWDPLTNIYTKKVDFDDSTSLGPIGNLLLNGGKFYGMTLFGGPYGGGTIFEWDPISNIFSRKVDLKSSSGTSGAGSLQLRDNKLYGMTAFGGAYNKGVIFEYDLATNIYSDKKDFTGADGASPGRNARLTLQGGKFYGCTVEGGKDGYGVIFEWDPVTNIYTKKVDLGSFGAHYSGAGLTFYNDNFYGTTIEGGSNNEGTIFQWDPVTNIFTKKIDFSRTQGQNPQTTLIVFENNLYGTAYDGGSADRGVIYEWNPSDNIYENKIDFGSLGGSLPQSALTYFDSTFYGNTQDGGISAKGVLFEWNPATNTYKTERPLSREFGNQVVGDLIKKNGKLYGVTKSGGNDNHGVIFEWEPVNKSYTKIFDFYLDDFGTPMGGLALYNSTFYGTTNSGGNNGGGVIFKWDPTIPDFSKEVELTSSGLTGSGIIGKLTLKNGKFYGMTQEGGIYNKGVIFEFDPSTSIYTKKVDLTTGAGNLVLYNDRFYGATAAGGSEDKGVIFEWDPATNVYTKKIDFTDERGNQPFGTLVLSGSKFYGTTSLGGGFNMGVFFEWDPVMNIYVKKAEFNGTNGATPYANELTLAPAPVAKGSPGSCTSFPSITIDSSNNDKWVPVIDTLGDVVAEIKANGNNLGVVNSSVFINNSMVREDAAHKLYLDRSIMITPAVKPNSAIDIRLYIKGSEYRALKKASNLVGQPSGIDSINDIGIFTNNDVCSSGVQSTLSPVISTAATWQADYVFSASIDSFSSFYFANRKRGTPTAPGISLTTPANNATFLSGGNVYFHAIASDADGKIVKVELYHDTALLFTATDTPYSFKWEHVRTGNYLITARASDNDGLITVSNTVHISVVPNTPPTVSIINPANGQTFLNGATIHLQAAATDADGRVSSVAFYNGTTLLATEHKLPYTFDWRIGKTGSYTITAEATDNWGAVTTSAAINISVVSNQPPSVSLVTPSNGKVFIAPATINLEALAQDADGRIVQVDFYNGTFLLTDQEHKAPYTYQWNNVPAGTYIITAVAKDNWSDKTVSTPITITVTTTGEPLVSSRSSSTNVTTAVKEPLSLKLLPNPAKDFLSINITGLQKDTPSTVSVISASGITLKTMQAGNFEKVIKLNVSSLANGVYIIKIIGGDKVIYKQFVKM